MQRQTFLYETPSGMACDFLKGILNLIGFMATQKGSFSAHLQIPCILLYSVVWECGAGESKQRNASQRRQRLRI